MPEFLKEPLEASPPPGQRADPRQLAVRCRGLRKVYDGRVEAVRGLDLEIPQGECFGLLGPNGAGKTTTIEILEGLLRPTSGEVEVLGERWGRRDHELRQRLGISLQETRLSEKLTVRETIRLFRSFYRRGLDPDATLEMVSLGSKARAQVGKLSGGQRQRLAVACALVGDPDLLFLDEPTTGLDPQSRRQLWEVIRDFGKRGRTVLLTTHYMDEAERLCNRVAIIDRGEIIALGSPAELISSLGGEHVIEFAVQSKGSSMGEPNGREAPAPGALIPAIKELRSVRAARADGSGISLTVEKPHLAIPALLEALQAHGLEIARLATRHASLEDVFVNLTGRHLRDEGNGSN
ncbi:MAG: ABC transporter ATP-binding protein [Planctomycetes bacterium]|nr:ABC transporter ATP-binding protein [Planctomycetota bacterium]